jgi:epoxyqueuosine reductase
MQGFTSEEIRQRIRTLGQELGFAALGFARAEIGETARQGLRDWLAAGRHGAMDYMARHATLREQPAELHPGTVSVISVRITYWPDAEQTLPAEATLADPSLGYVSRYALGRDYHKTLRQRLQTFSERIAAQIGPFGHRVFVDSAPVMEVEFARQAALGWRGKHTLLLTRQGSWHFLGELYTDLPLPPDAPDADHCGSCTACLAACPTQAIVAPYQLDARRCISYLTIEHPGSIPEELRPLLGNRIYGCDDCQLCCPWNRFGQVTREIDFAVRNALDRTPLSELFAWSEADFNNRLAGTPIRRIGHERWLRNIAVGLGNALRQAASDSPTREVIVAALQSRRDDPSALIREHVAWALAQTRRHNDESPQ